MRTLGIVSVPLVCVLGLAAALPTPAQQQQKPGKLTLIQEDTVKAGAREQYEAGRKELAAWHASIKDPNELAVFETRTGENAKTYLVARRGLNWADLDKDLVPKEQRMAELKKAIGDSQAKSVTRMYEEVPELGHDLAAKTDRPEKFYEINTFHVPLNKTSAFIAGLTRYREAVEKTKTPVDFSVFELAQGGEFGTWIVVTAHDTWASFDDAVVKSPPDILLNAFGPNEGRSVLAEIENAMGGFFTSEVVEFRPDLSYFPAK
ncbi:MAG TPA: hypothetical protein VJT08_07435 [Terriglobales bacterium]|nr:hypothetical protein [Acidobacteriaceae bacterium]HKR30292.1 hypothetical protein [Terriglobales bacterium]